MLTVSEAMIALFSELTQAQERFQLEHPDVHARQLVQRWLCCRS
jgi:hypothetical protein